MTEAQQRAVRRADVAHVVAVLTEKLVDEGCIGEDRERSCAQDGDVRLDDWCLPCLAGALIQSLEDR